MKKIATENSIVVLTPNGAWSWASGRPLKIPVTGSTAPFTVNGEPVLLEKNVVDVLKASVPKQMYRHCDAATDYGGIASVGVEVNDDSLTQKAKATKSKLVTSETNGGFNILVSKPSSVNGVPDPITQHEGSWLIEDARQAMLDDPPPPRDECDKIRIWMRAFIPNDGKNVRCIGKNRWLFKFWLIDLWGFKRSPTCVETDHRDSEKSYRVKTDFTLHFVDMNVKEVNPDDGKAHQPGMSQVVDCETGVRDTEKRKPGEFLEGGRSFKQRVSDGKAEIRGKVSIRAPHLPNAIDNLYDKFKKILPSKKNLKKSLPPADYSFYITYAKTGKTGKLEFLFKIGVWPAFEAYVEINDFQTQILNMPPSDKGPRALFDGGGRINTEQRYREMTLKRDECGRMQGDLVCPKCESD